MRMVFRFHGVPPYMEHMIRADFEYNTWEARHHAYRYLTKLLKDREVLSKLTADQRAKIEEMRRRLHDGAPMVVRYRCRRDGADVIAELEFEDDFFKMYRDLKRVLPLHYRLAVSPLDRMLNEHKLLLRMLKVGKDLYGVEIEGWVEKES